MVYPLNAVVSLLVLKNRHVQNKGALTAISAFTPGILGLAVPFVAEAAAEHEGRGRGQLSHRAPQGAQGQGGGDSSPPVNATHAQVPDLTGLTLSAAQQKLQHLGLTAQPMDVYSDGSHGKVVSQSPAANTVVDLAAPTGVGLAPPTVTVGIGRRKPPAAAPPSLSTHDELDQIRNTVGQVLTIVQGIQATAAAGSNTNADKMSQTGDGEAPDVAPASPQSVSKSKSAS